MFFAAVKVMLLLKKFNIYYEIIKPKIIIHRITIYRIIDFEIAEKFLMINLIKTTAHKKSHYD